VSEQKRFRLLETVNFRALDECVLSPGSNRKQWCSLQAFTRGFDRSSSVESVMLASLGFFLWCTQKVSALVSMTILFCFSSIAGGDVNAGNGKRYLICHEDYQAMGRLSGCFALGWGLRDAWGWGSLCFCLERRQSVGANRAAIVLVSEELGLAISRSRVVYVSFFQCANRDGRLRDER